MALSTPRPNLDEALEALRRSEQRYRSLVEATASLTFIADREGQLISDMPAWREITGQGREEILGTGWLDAIHPADRDAVADAWRTSVETRSICAVEYRIRRAAGGWTWLFVRAAPVVERDGSVREYVGVCIDISPAKELEMALEPDDGPRGVLERIARFFLAHEWAQMTTLTYAEIDAAEHCCSTTAWSRRGPSRSTPASSG